MDMLRAWLSEERLPDGWKPTHTQGLLETIHTSNQIASEMKKFEADGEDTAPAVGSRISWLLCISFVMLVFTFLQGTGLVTY